MKDNRILGNIFNILGKNQNQFQQKMRQSEMRDKMRKRMNERRQGQGNVEGQGVKECKKKNGIWGEEGTDDLAQRLKEANEKAERIMEELLAEENFKAPPSKKKRKGKKR